MKQGWTYKLLGDCINKVPKQKQVKSKDYQSSGKYPIVSQEKDLISGYWDDDSFLYKHDKPVIIFGDHTKEIKYIDFDFVVGADGTQILSPKSDLNAKFFYFSLLATPIRSLGYARHFKLLKEKSFPIPPLAEQERIVERLDAAFAQIDELKNNAERQLAEAHALFQSVMLIAFTPKAGWKSVKLGDICKIKSGSSTANNSSSGNLPYVKVADMNLPENSEFITTSTRFVDRYENEKGIFPVGSVIFPKRGGAILTNKKRLTNVEICCDLNIMGLVSKDTSVLNNDFLFQWFKQFDLSSVSSGTTVLQLNNCDITPVSIALPPLSIQKSIVEYLNDLSRRIRSLEEIFNKTVADCDALKQALLKQIFE